jgi:hypothetical protein
MTSQRKKASIVVRNATLEDVPKIAALVIKVYKNPADGYTPGMLRGQISSAIRRASSSRKNWR